jgi:integrase
MSTRLSIDRTYPPPRKSMPKECLPGSGPGGQPATANSLDLAVSKLEGTARIFAECLLITGARPCELLNIRYQDIDHRGMVYIRAAKRGRSRFALCPPILRLKGAGGSDPSAPVFRTFTYKQFYRAMARVLELQGARPHVHRPVGRLFRRAYAARNHALGPSDLAAVTLSLGHRSKSSTLYYLGGGEVKHGKDS